MPSRNEIRDRGVRTRYEARVDTVESAADPVTLMIVPRTRFYVWWKRTRVAMIRRST